MEEEKDMNPCHQRWVARTQQHRKTKVQLWGGLVVFTFSNGWNVIVLRDIFELCIHLLCITLVLEVTSRVTCLLEVLARLFWLKVPGQNTPLLICWLDIRWPRCMVAIEWANLEWFDIVVLWIIFTTTFTLWHLTKWVTTSQKSKVEKTDTIRTFTLPSGRSITIYD